MAGKNKKIIGPKEEYEKAMTREQSWIFPLEKLNLGPRKKFLVMNLNGLFLYRVHRSQKSELPKTRSADGHYRGYLDLKLVLGLLQ
ncbi:unnamed protein product [Sphenostylis stenocarpa]|uniref:Uncharacterized protein n=1 Tax=Sphenostylis stenocarpa TaxID=92480 RepID=A0AA86VB24_9FABA|nr:unnamed protein product [Sphenostylis stenocarpa]